MDEGSVDGILHQKLERKQVASVVSTVAEYGKLTKYSGLQTTNNSKWSSQVKKKATRQARAQMKDMLRSEEY